MALGTRVFVWLRISPCACENSRLVRRQVLIALDYEVKIFSFISESKQTKLMAELVVSRQAR